MGNFAMHVHLLNKPELTAERLIQIFIKTAAEYGCEMPAKIINEIDGGKSQDNNVILFLKPDERWICMYHNFFPSDPCNPYEDCRGFVKALALEAGTTVISTTLSDSDTIIFTMSDGREVHMFSRGFNPLFGFDEDNTHPEDSELHDDFPDHIWLSLLAPEYSLSDVMTEVDRYEKFRERLSDWDAFSENESRYVDAFVLQMNLSELMGCNCQLANFDYDHLSHLDFTEEDLKGYTVLQMIFKRSKKGRFFKYSH